MARPKRPWSKTVEESGVSVRVYERAPGSVLYRETRDAGGRKDRRSLGHRDRALAEAQARQLARRVAELRFAGHAGPVTLGQLCALYAQHRAPLLSPKRRGEAATFAALFRAHLGDAFCVDDLSQTDVDRYVAARRSGALRALGDALRDGEAPRGVRDGTLSQDLRWLASACRWAQGFRLRGRRLLTTDPMAGLALPRERNPKRPVASEERFRRTIAHTDAVDPSGRLRVALALARYTGRRISAICSLRASDALLSLDQVARALAAAGLDERLAEHMPHGALRWRAEHDKLGFFEITALGRGARAALEASVKQSGRVGDAWLFPSDMAPDRPLDGTIAGRLLRKAEAKAELPKLERGRFHPYRRLFAVEGKTLPDVDVAKAGGWRDTRAMKESYQRPDPATVLKVVENVGGGHTLDTPPAQPTKVQ